MIPESEVKKVYNFFNISLLSFLVFMSIRAATFSVVPASENLTTLFTVVNLVVLVFALCGVYRMAKQLKLNGADKTHPVLWVIAMFIPLFNLIAILIMYKKARALLKEAPNRGANG